MADVASSYRRLEDDLRELQGKVNTLKQQVMEEMAEGKPSRTYNQLIATANHAIALERVLKGDL